MLAVLLKGIKAIEILKQKSVQNLGKKIMVAILSPVIGFMFLIGGIFADGINYNHNLVNDLYNSVPVPTEGMTPDKVALIQQIEAGIALLNRQIEIENPTFEEGRFLDPYLVKGYYIGLMFTVQGISLTNESVQQWTDAFITEEKKDKETKRNPTSDPLVIFPKIEKNFSITLAQETKQSMQKVVEGLRGGGSVGGTVTTLTKEEIEKLIKNLPKDTTQLRKDIVIQAADAVGKVPYYWGGAAVVPGYEGNDFGIPYTPDEHGRPLKGMDCSHFVDWVYWTVMGNNLGNTNTEGQIVQCSRIDRSQLLPGDLAFLMENGVTTHVGIYAGTNENGDAVWIHENADDNNVSMNTVSYWNVYCRLNIMEGR